MPSRIIRILPAMAALALVTAAHAQGSGMVSVDLTTVHEPLAQRMGIDSARMPMSILAPAEVAAAACGLRPEALSLARGGGGCTATSAVAQLDPILRDRMRQDEAMGAPAAPKADTSSKSGPADKPSQPAEPMPAEKP